MRTSRPVYDDDLFSPDGIINPYGHYRSLRALGGAVFMPTHNIWAIPRFSGVKHALEDTTTFISGKGIAISDQMNEMLVGSIITSDGPAHARIRAFEAAPLMPRSLDALREQVRSEARQLVSRLVVRRSFDGVVDLAQHLPVTIVADLVGLPEKGRENMLEWSASIFQLVGPLNALSQNAVADCVEMFDFVQGVDRKDVRQGSWADRIFGLCEDGTIDREEAARMLVDLIGPALDTTIFGISNMLLLLGQNPDQWARLKADPRLVSNAVNEVLRLESPIRGFTRFVTRDAEFEDTVVPADSRVLILYASANRDERMWGDDADRFDVGRSNSSKQLAFGYGRHSCLGMHLARLEMSAVLEAMIEQISRFSIGEPEMAMITSLRGLKSLAVTLH